MRSLSFRRPGAQACRSERKGGIATHQRPLAHRIPDPGLCACTHAAPSEISWAPALACSTYCFGLRASLSGSLIIPPPSPELQPQQWALELGCIWGLLTLPAHLYSQPGSAQLPHTDLALPLLLLPEAGHRFAHGSAPSVTHVLQRHQTNCAVSQEARTRNQLLSQKGKAKAWG